jgi:branched-chain amino acid transport system ATP-binding protein
MTHALLRVEEVSKHYGGLTVTDRLTLEIAANELHAIIGPNGAGKTTLIQQITGWLAPESGRILFDGRDITRLSIADRVRRGMARSFQLTSVLPRFSALENVALAIQARSGSSFRFFVDVTGETALNVAAAGLLERFGLGERADVPAGHLSHGEQRQLELAIALATEPKLLLLDEPLAGTGHEEARRIVALLQQLKGSLAIMLIEHDMEAVFALADRVSVMLYGRLIATGTPAEIRDNPQVRAAYLGAEPVLPC